MPRGVRKAHRGQPVPSDGWNRIADFMKRNIIGGDGIAITRQNQQIVVSKTGKNVPGGGDAGISVDTVETLPAIPASSIRWVYWTSAGVGTGDNQIWFATWHDSVWWPTQIGTTKVGTPGS